MALVILILKIYVCFSALIMIVYTIRHFIFTLNRVAGEQRIYYQDIMDSELPTVSVLVPMHNEEKVARDILNSLLGTSYPGAKLEILPIMLADNPNETLETLENVEIIPIDDHSTDGTKKILAEYAAKYPQVMPVYRQDQKRGKARGLNDAIDMARGDIIVVFDADYIPGKGIIKDLAVCFKDPEVGAVMGRVIPLNTKHSLLTRLLDLERSGGYQVDQQARHNLKLMPQYGGTVGAFRRDIVIDIGGFNPNSLTEDTELTFRLFTLGWKVLYANRAECYEEVPEDWNVRARQIKRWSRGHNRVMFGQMWPLLKSKYLTGREKIDGALLLGVYATSFIFVLAAFCSLALFFLGEMEIFPGILFLIMVITYNAFGNFAPFYQIATASFLDGGAYRIRLLPLFIFTFFFNLWYVFLGFLYAVVDVVTRRKTRWDKTSRYRKTEVTS
ncbi:MAG: glycosyltransferase [Candidatus Ratteibacteria bacterium]|jgi:cellulose synthase/poly-beta-1,6-N-acetylglucosamine synthase-like glycosyltransferase